MKAWLLKDFGLNNLQFGEVPTPKPKAGEMLIKVGAVSLNFRDKAIVDGIYAPEKVPKPLIPVSDVVGTVVSVGDGVGRFQVGDRVSPILYSRWLDGIAGPHEDEYSYGTPLHGGLAEYMIVDEQSAVKAPENMSDEEASTLPIAALTPWYCMMDIANLQPGQTVLIQGTGGVAIFAIQLANAYGARVIVTSSRDENLLMAKALGAHEGINYRKHPQWEHKVLELTDGKGVDLTLDMGGGDGVNQSIQATKVGGTVAQVGFLSGQTTTLDLMQLIFRRTRLQGIAVAPRSSFERMIQFLDKHPIKPVIDHVYAFDEALQAYEHLSRGPFGKVVIKVGG